MKKILLFMAAALGLGLCAHAAAGDEFTVDGIVYRVISEEEHTVAVSNGSNAEGDYVMPTTVTNGETAYTITKIGRYGFQGCKAASFTISNTVQAIDPHAFNGCENLISVEIPSSVRTLGIAVQPCVFVNCPKLESVSLPEGLKTICSLFSNCPSITKITIPSTVTTLGAIALSCENLDTIVALPKIVPSIADYAFGSTPATAIVYVPKGTILKYSNAEGWNHFSDFRVEGVIDMALSEKSLTMVVGETKTLVPAYTNITPESETWTSSHAKAATVADGVVTAHAEGTATITLTVIDQYRITHAMRCEVKVTSEAGIAGIEAEATPEYFNLGGLRVSEDALTPGIYIKRQGAKASKVIVK